METIIIVLFVLGYLAITLEHNLKVDKLIPALAMMAFMWAIISLAHLPVFEVNAELKELSPSHIDEILLHHLGKTAEIIIFLLGAMTIVEIIDYFNGFFTIKNFIKTRSKKGLLWIFGILAFILSAIIDNLTATIVLITILQKVVHDRQTRLWFAGLIIVAANAGGAWSPIGDVTTTMLWIGDKVTTLKLISYVLVPSIVCLVLPVGIASFLPAFQGEIKMAEDDSNIQTHKRGATMLYLGLSAIVFVPVFKTLTHLPPYVGMMLSLAIVSTFAEIFSKAKINITSIDAESDAHQTASPLHRSLSKIELPSILFFLGILLAVAALESLGMLFNFAEGLNTAIPNTDIVIALLGIGSAVIDNVPLVAASMGMFSMGTDDPVWHLIAYSAGTGGSMLIIGSAAGVVAMGMEKIDFFWYFKKIAWLALVGFLGGFGTFILLRDYVL
ncbi:MAG: sodium:proton antiporter NhaD [Flavobacteriaceae bacterium]|jgi:Na+/H+ antiporter NhaD/arsenite permease-like protein|nr:sodium:proton antiporter NhaD [Flavobacteriaceae bacterium]MDB2340558.1 sodium:proton antiporter NhaD [Flavobacteriaceae bacterium]MDG1710865.1 sodium:proton antiporter NhaD [Flavobacteriaceae bacterium]MDG2504182.1 sodium:proton antiporter NhaD [Flavobacteriaceae bacterium]|tara:strand:- start:2182 stop:3510 length:1329 start_codon:yes stop_codon:yes gene_type:complete